MRTLLLVLCLWAMGGSVQAQWFFFEDLEDVLYVADPQEGLFSREPGTIEEATFQVTPRGIYAEVDVFLTFSDRNTRYRSDQNLEVQFKFTLPPEAAITDSWLWVGEDIVKATLIDRWTASQIYEGIVDRNRDPSLLIKHDDGEYELRVFPMPGGTTRRVKITYLVPVDWTATRVRVPLPFNMLRSSFNPVENTVILTPASDLWSNPAMTEEPDIPVEGAIDGNGNLLRRIELDRAQMANVESISFDSPMEDGVFLTTYGQERPVYQAAYMPFRDQDIESNRKIVLLIDFNEAKTSVDQAEIFERAREIMRSYLTPADSFNVAVTQEETTLYSDEWLPGTDEEIDRVFDDLGAAELSTFSDLTKVLTAGIAFVRDHGNEGNVVLVTSAETVFDFERANQLLVDLQVVRSPLPPIHVMDIANIRVSQVYVGFEVYEGNSYLYSNLSRISGGQYLTIRSGRSLANLFRTTLSNLGGALRNVDLYVTAGGGFTFGRYTSVRTVGGVPANTTITQVGNFVGALPFTIEATGFLRDEAFAYDLTVDSADPVDTDSTLELYWTGQHIRALENAATSNGTISEAIDLSLERRVLSEYTAFLALEPGLMDTEICEECLETLEDVVAASVEDDETPQSSVTLEAYPNPFATSVTIRIEFPELTDLRAYEFVLYNAMGQVVKTFAPDAGLDRAVEIVWDGANEAGEAVSSGIYFLVVRGPMSRHTLKLVRVR